MDDGQEAHRSRAWRQLGLTQDAASALVYDFPAAFSQALPEHVSSVEVALGPKPRPLRQQGFGLASLYRLFLAFTASVSLGTIFKASPTTPRSAIFMIGASASLLIAMITFELFMPTVCCMAPEIPTAM